MSGTWNLWLLTLATVAATLVTPCLSLPERTFAMIKPDGVQSNHTFEIRQIILAEGFNIVRENSAHLDDVAAKSFYREHAERTFFTSLIRFMTSGPVHGMILEREDAILKWRTLMGPTDSIKARIQDPDSIRAKFGIDGEKNCVHGSDSQEAALREIAVFFGVSTPGVYEISEREVESPRRVHEEL